ncbi:MAG: HDOD domain-containing protein [bacterium]
MNQSAQTQQTRRLELWRGKLNASGLPVFSRTIRDIRNVSSSSLSSARDLSEVIGHDASMAARVIQIANSPLFNLQNRDIDTISSAVVLVGFDAVRELAISVSVIEEMLKGHQHARVGQHMAQAFHAAAQARSFARICGHKCEEVFVAALLKEVGDMAFWSRAEREAVAIEALVAGGSDLVQAQREVLGFELADLGRVLAADWNLGDLVGHVLDGKHDDQPLVQHVQFGHQVAHLLRTSDIESDTMSEVVGQLAKHLNMKGSDVKNLLRRNLDAAGHIAKQFGVAQSLLWHEQLAGNDVNPAEQDASKADANNPAGEGERGYDADQLFAALTQLAEDLEAGGTRDELMQQIVNGLHQAVGFAQVYFALFTPDRSKLVVKYSAGTEAVSARAWPPHDPRSVPVFVRALTDFKAQTFTDVAQQNAWHFGGAGAVVAVKLAQKPVGMLYAENAMGQSVSAEQFMGFRQLGQQIALVLSQAP